MPGVGVGVGISALTMRGGGSGGGGGIPGSYVFTDTQYMSLNTTAIANPPLTLAIWAKLASITNGRVAMSLNETTNFGSFSSVTYTSAHVARSFNGATREGGGPIIPTGAWVHLAVKLVSDSSRQAFTNGVGGSVGTDLLNLDPFTLLLINAYWNGASGSGMTGQFAHAAAWDVGLSDAQILELAEGALPTDVAGANLKFYAPLNTAVPKDVITNTNLSLTGPPTFDEEDGPPIG